MPPHKSHVSGREGTSDKGWKVKGLIAKKPIWIIAKGCVFFEGPRFFLFLFSERGGPPFKDKALRLER